MAVAGQWNLVLPAELLVYRLLHRLGDYEYALVRRFTQGRVDVIYLELFVTDEAMGPLTDHP